MKLVRGAVCFLDKMWNSEKVKAQEDNLNSEEVKKHAKRFLWLAKEGRKGTR